MKKNKIAIIGASGKLGKQLLKVGLAKDYEIVAVCREKSVSKLDEYKGKITVFPGHTNNREVIQKAVKNCLGVLCILVPWGTQNYSSGTAQAVLDFAEKDARLVFSCGWHISMDGKDKYSNLFLKTVKIMSWVFKFLRIADVDDQVEACSRIFQSQSLWTVVRGSDLEDGKSQGMPVWSDHVGDAILARNRIRRIDYAEFMVHAMEQEEFIHKCPAISAALE